MKKIFFVLFLIFSIFQFYTQEALKSLENEYYDFLSLTGQLQDPTIGYKSLSDNSWKLNEEADIDHVWKNNNLGKTFFLWESNTQDRNFFTKGIKEGISAKIYGPQWFNSYNTFTPYGQNDGALWQGRGFNTALSAGIRLEAYGFEITFNPLLSWNENKDFPTNADIYPNEYSYGFTNGNVDKKIDYVRRYGNKAFCNYDWGDSEIRWSWYNFTLGVGTQNAWIGPAYVNPMLGSNNAPGYLKFDIGLRKTELKTSKLNFGSIEVRLWLGQLIESEYFDNDNSNNKRMLTGLCVNYQPSFIPGFSIGLNRIFNTKWSTENLHTLIRLFTLSQTNSTNSGNDEDQKATLFAQWHFPTAGFCVYGEYGFDDFTSNKMTNPFHTGIYTLGIKQAIPFFKGLKSELILEWNNFELSQDFQFQWPYIGFYSHHEVNQGYTNKGQIIGGASCWAGNSQFLQYKVFYPKGATALIIHRYCPDNNAILSQAVNTSSDAWEDPHPIYEKWYANYETYLCFGLQSQYFITNNLIIDGAFTYIQIFKYNYIENNDQNNFNIALGIKYNF